MTGLAIASLIGGALKTGFDIYSGVQQAYNTPKQNTGLMNSLNNEIQQLNAANTVENISKEASGQAAKTSTVNGLAALETARSAGGSLGSNRALAMGKESENFLNGYQNAYNNVSQNYQNRLNSLQNQFNNAAGIASTNYNNELNKWKAWSGLASGISNNLGNTTQNLMNMG